MLSSGSPTRGANPFHRSEELCAQKVQRKFNARQGKGKEQKTPQSHSVVVPRVRMKGRMGMLQLGLSLSRFRVCYVAARLDRSHTDKILKVNNLSGVGGVQDWVWVVLDSIT